MIGETIGYRVTVWDENGLKVEYEQDFMNADHEDALALARRNARRVVCHCFPDGFAEVCRLVVRLVPERLAAP